MNVMTLFSMQECERGPVLIGGGLLLMLLAQIGSGFPVVTPIALVGWGAVCTLHARPRSCRQDVLSIVQLATYSTLVLLAIMVQSNLVFQEAVRHIHFVILLDHAAAIVLVIGLAAHMVSRLGQPLAEKR
ncbi:MAG: hypothetical protein MK171_02855 [Pirellulales bacterium]|nr:hypothetical protein [Pirellulales bacterium]